MSLRRPAQEVAGEGEGQPRGRANSATARSRPCWGLLAAPHLRTGDLNQNGLAPSRKPNGFHDGGIDCGPSESSCPPRLRRGSGEGGPRGFRLDRRPRAISESIEVDVLELTAPLLSSYPVEE